MAVPRGHQAASARSRSERIAPAKSGNQVQLGYAWGWHILGAEHKKKNMKKMQPLVLWKIDHSLSFDEAIFPFPSDNLPHGKPIMCRSFSLGNHGYFSLLPMFTSRYIWFRLLMSPIENSKYPRNSYIYVYPLCIPTMWPPPREVSLFPNGTVHFMVYNWLSYLGAPTLYGQYWTPCEKPEENSWKAGQEHSVIS